MILKDCTLDFNFKRDMISQGLFADISRTLFRVGSLVSMEIVGQDNVLGSSKLSRKRDELEEKCKVLERKNSEVGNELVKLWAKVKLVDSLPEDVDRYNSPSNLVAQIMMLKASLTEGDKR